MIHSFIKLKPFFRGLWIDDMPPDQVRLNQPNRGFFFPPISEVSQIDNYSQEDLAKFCCRKYMIICILNLEFFYIFCCLLEAGCSGHLEFWILNFKIWQIFFKANIFTKILCVRLSRNISQFEKIGKAQKENVATNLKS
jgi:hypothetical protein